VCGGQQLTRRLFAHDVGPAGSDQLERRVGLATFELMNGERTCKIGDRFLQVSGQYSFVETMGVAHSGQLNVSHCLPRVRPDRVWLVGRGVFGNPGWQGWDDNKGRRALDVDARALIWVTAICESCARDTPYL